MHQLDGQKRILLLEPTDSAHLYADHHAAGEMGNSPLDPHAVDLHAYPLVAEATVWPVVLKPGDVLLIPSFWWHLVATLPAAADSPPPASASASADPFAHPSPSAAAAPGAAALGPSSGERSTVRSNADVRNLAVTVQFDRSGPGVANILARFSRRRAELFLELGSEARAVPTVDEMRRQGRGPVRGGEEPRSLAELRAHRG